MAIPLIGASLLGIITGSIVRAFLFLISFLVVRFLALIGFSYIIYSGVDSFVDKIYLRLQSHIEALPDFILTALSILRIDIYISIIISAVILKLSVTVASKITLFK